MSSCHLSWQPEACFAHTLPLPFWMGDTPWQQLLGDFFALSPRWLGDRHPDPKNQQLPVLQTPGLQTPGWCFTPSRVRRGEKRKAFDVRCTKGSSPLPLQRMWEWYRVNNDLDMGCQLPSQLVGTCCFTASPNNDGSRLPESPVGAGVPAPPRKAFRNILNGIPVATDVASQPLGNTWNGATDGQRCWVC